MRNYTVYYPCKVNSAKEVVAVINACGSSFETDSIEMITHLLGQGICPNKILYNYLVRSSDSIEKAVSFGVDNFAVDCKGDALKILKCSPNAKFIVRVSINALTPHVVEAYTDDKWGADLGEARAIADCILSHGGKLIGYSFYYPKEFNTVDRIFIAIKRLVDEFGENITIDIGGGISVADADEIAEKFPSLRGRLIMEPGRHLVGDVFDCRCSVIDVKERRGRKYVFLNVGIYSGFIDAVLKKHRFEIVTELDYDGELEEVVVCGCTSDISDTFGTYRLPSSALKEGVTLVIKNCGAYCPEMYTRFAGNPMNDNFILVKMLGGKS